MSEPQATFNYRVLNQDKRLRTDPSTGKAVYGYVVSFIDGVTGVTSDVFVPESVWTPQNVAAMIESQLQTIREIGALGQ